MSVRRNLSGDRYSYCSITAVFAQLIFFFHFPLYKQTFLCYSIFKHLFDYNRERIFLMLIRESLTIQQKLEILSDAAKYDVACTSSGTDRQGRPGTIGNTAAGGICHSFAADGRCISLLKVLLTNACIYDCKYCVNRASNDTVRTYFTPEELCSMTIQFYRRNYIEGLFLSSGILQSPDHTMELLYQTLYLLREKYRFWGYIHVKAIPGADPALIRLTGRLADRMSVNLELPTAQGLKMLAPAKTRTRLLTPMRQIQQGIAASRLPTGGGSSRQGTLFPLSGEKPAPISADPAADFPASPDAASFSDLPARFPPADYAKHSRFVPAGQSTQMIVGATPETDHQILSVAQALYRQFDLKRVFYSAYSALNEDSSLPAPGTPPPLLREHRLYQADWLLRFYGFTADELLSEEQPYFNLLLDPKCHWAIAHLEQFPVEVSQASYAMLLRVPGIGVKSARRIVAARRYSRLDFPALKKMGVVLKRAGHFLTCGGKMYHPIRLDQTYLANTLAAADQNQRLRIEGSFQSFRQLSLFDDFHLAPPSGEDAPKALFGQF